MDSLGRGRGRVNYPAPLRRPGHLASPPDYIMSMNALVPDIVEPELLDIVMAQVGASCSSASAAQEVVETIYNFSIKNRHFAKVAGEVFARIISLKKDGCKKAVLDKLQHGFDDREKLLVGGGAELTNFVCLLGFFYNKAFLRTGVPLHVVAEPLAICLGLVVNRNVPRIEVFTEQLVINGDRLQQHAPNHLDQLMSKAREILVLSEPPVEKTGLLYLLLCIELQNNKFQPLTDKAMLFYESNWAPKQMPTIIKRLKAGAWKISVSTLKTL